MRDLDWYKQKLVELFTADDSYGCGFYSEEDWMMPYQEIRESLIEEGVYDPSIAEQRYKERWGYESK